MQAHQRLASILFLLLLTISAKALIVTNRVTVMADAYVRSDLITYNQGSFTNVYVRTNSANGTATCYGYFKLNLTTLSNVAGAALRVHAPMMYTGSVVLRAYSVANTNWAEGIITWSNKPPSSNLLSSVTVNVTDTAGRWYEFDVSNFIKGEVAAGRSFATILLVEPTILTGNAANYARIVAREFAMNQPELAWNSLHVSVGVTDGTASEVDTNSGTFTISADRVLASPLTVRYALSGQARLFDDYYLNPPYKIIPSASYSEVTIPAGASSVSVEVVPIDDVEAESSENVTLTVVPNGNAYVVDTAAGTIAISDNAANPYKPWQDVFNPYRVLRLDLTMAQTDWDAVVAGTETGYVDADMEASLDPAWIIDVKVRRGGGGSGFSGVVVDINGGGEVSEWRGLQKLSLDGLNVLDQGLGYQVHRLVSDAGFYGYDAGRFNWMRLFVNGTFIGVVVHQERHDDQFIKNRSLYKTGASWFYQFGNGIREETLGTPGESPTFLNLCYPYPGAWYPCTGLSAAQREQQVPQWYDLNALSVYWAIQDFMNHGDSGPGNNYYRGDFYIKDRLSLSFPWDLDSLNISSGSGNDYTMYANLEAQQPYMKQRFAETLRALLNGPLSTSVINPFVTRMETVLTPHLEQDTRWPNALVSWVPPGQNPTIHDYFDWVRNWMTTEASIMADWTDATGRAGAPTLPAPVDAPQFSQLGGTVTAPFSLTMSAGSGATIYYTTDGTDPIGPATGGGTTVSVNGVPYSSALSISSSMHVMARACTTSGWSPITRATFDVSGHLNALRITETHYHPANPSSPELAVNADFDDDDFQFIEFKNEGANTIDLSGCQITGVGVALGKVTYSFPPGKKLSSGDHLVLVQNPAAFEARYGCVDYQGVFAGKLDKNGGTVVLKNASGTTIINAAYDDQSPWPDVPSWETDGDGPSLVMANGAASPNSYTYWRASTFAGGSPGVQDPTIQYTLVVPPGHANDPTFAPVAALAIDEPEFGSVATGYGVSSGSYYAYFLDSDEYPVAIRILTSDQNCPDLYYPQFPYAWTSRGNGVSDGLVVGLIGYDDWTNPTAATWQGGPTPVGGCDNWDQYPSEAKAYSANGYAGHIAGYQGAAARRGDIFNGWTETLAGFSSSPATVANSVNYFGDAAGFSQNPSDSKIHPWFWPISGSGVQLPLLPSAVQGEVLAINKHNSMVGYCITSSGTKRACLWRKSGGTWIVVALGLLGSSTYSVATDINNNGQIVGYSGGNACEWVNCLAVDLNSRMPSSSYVLTRAYAINDGGYIAGCTAWGTESSPPSHLPENSTARAFILYP